jgi:hypothetical protein
VRHSSVRSPMSHLETLVAEYLEWQGYLIRRNTKVGRLKHGGWEMELDIVGYHPKSLELVHYEPSIDALSWDTNNPNAQRADRGAHRVPHDGSVTRNSRSRRQSDRNAAR